MMRDGQWIAGNNWTEWLRVIEPLCDYVAQEQAFRPTWPVLIINHPFRLILCLSIFCYCPCIPINSPQILLPLTYTIGAINCTNLRLCGVRRNWSTSRRSMWSKEVCANPTQTTQRSGLNLGLWNCEAITLFATRLCSPRPF